MILEKQDVKVWVDVNDRTQLMPRRGNFPIKFDNGETRMFNEEDYPFAICTHWLKTVKDVYVLTENQLETLKKEYYGIGLKEAELNKTT